MSWLKRQSFLGNDSDTVLSECKIGIVGLGGGGSHVVQQLAHVGIGTFVIVDPDTFEDSNLNRVVGAQFADIKPATPKIEIATRVIRSVRPDARIVSIQADWQTAGDALKTCDVIVGGLDSVRAKDELDAFCRRFLIPYIDMGMDVHGTPEDYLISGQVVLSSPGTPCLRCLHIVTDKGLEQEGAAYGAAGGKPQVVWPNGVLASTAVGLLMQIITPWHSKPVDAAYLEYDGNTGAISTSYRLKHAQSRDCPHYPPNERGDPTFDIRRPTAPILEVEEIEQPPQSWLSTFAHWLRRLFNRFDKF